MKILVTGATGLLGKELGKALVARGYDLVVVSRKKSRTASQLPFPCRVLAWDLVKGPLPASAELEGVDVVINLAGEPIFGGRWTEARKRRIYESRVLGSRHLIASLKNRPKVFISASATGYYGSQGDEELTEESAGGDGFLSQVCQDWEGELLSFSYGDGGTFPRVVALRTGMVLASQGGAMALLLPLFRHGLGSVLGEGRQWMSWIHIDDAIGLILHAMDKSSISGAMNVVAPSPVTNEEFSKVLAGVLGKSLGPRAPEAALWAVLGEGASLVLLSQRVLPKVALETSYSFRYPELSQALTDICRGAEAEKVHEESYLSWPVEKVFQASLSATGKSDYSLSLMGLRMKWKTRVVTDEKSYQIVEEQTEGFFKSWHWQREFQALGEGTLVVQEVRYRMPLGLAGELVGETWLRSEIRKLLRLHQEKLVKNLKPPEARNDPALHEAR